jgi:hypothetical protein
MINFSRPELTFDHPSLFGYFMILTRKKGERRKVDIMPPKLFANEYVFSGDLVIELFEQLNKFPVLFKNLQLVDESNKSIIMTLNSDVFDHDQLVDWLKNNLHASDCGLYLRDENSSNSGRPD